MPFDTDGTHWMTVRYTVEMQVIADTAEDALYFADLRLEDFELSDLSAEVLDADRPIWIIQDWMSNRLWPNLEFDSFEDAWSHIRETTPEPDEDSPDWVDGWFEDFYVVEKKMEKSND